MRSYTLSVESSRCCFPRVCFALRVCVSVCGRVIFLTIRHLFFPSFVRSQAVHLSSPECSCALGEELRRGCPDLPSNQSSYSWKFHESSFPDRQGVPEASRILPQKQSWSPDFQTTARKVKLLPLPATGRQTRPVPTTAMEFPGVQKSWKESFSNWRTAIPGGIRCP